MVTLHSVKKRFKKGLVDSIRLFNSKLQQFKSICGVFAKKSLTSFLVT
jgi:hypothetical protein